LNPSQNHKCNECNLIYQCKKRFEQKLKRYTSIDKKGQNTIIDFDLSHFALAINDNGNLALDTLFIKFANDESEFERGECSGTFKMPTATHADFYRSLISILTNPANLTHQTKYVDWIQK
jgi:hypothetical protein